MKPPAFEYHAPSSLDAALALLRDLGPDAKPLAGGQSLTPMLNFRLLHPAHLVDLNRIPALAYISVEEGELCIGAMTRHSEVERSAIVRDGWPLISEAMRHVAHVQIRNRGTLGGSLSHADPAAEMPAVMTALEARMILRNSEASRKLPADEFFVAALTTALAPGELLVEIRIPPVPPRTGAAFDELARRRGDFALVGVAALVTLDAAGAVSRARLVFTGVDERPVRSRRAEAVLIGKRAEMQELKSAAQAAAQELTPQSDLHASAEYRREVGEVMARRVLQTAAERAAALLK